jgi:hypothetical protein
MPETKITRHAGTTLGRSRAGGGRDVGLEETLSATGEAEAYLATGALASKTTVSRNTERRLSFRLKNLPQSFHI